MAEPQFYVPSRRYTAGEIATLAGAELANDTLAGNEISRLVAAEQGGPGTLVYVEKGRHAKQLDTLTAAAVLCPVELAARVPAGIAALTTPVPALAFATVAGILCPAAASPQAVTGETGLSPAAHIAADALVEPGAIVEAGAIVGPGAAVGRGTVIAPGVVIGPGCQIGRDCYVGASASIVASLIGDRVIIHAGARIGQDGFRFMPSPGGLKKMPQLGRVVIQDDVEIGANTTIDRGALSDTLIGEGTKIDNLVQLGHNVRIGRHCAIAAHVGISGSVEIGDFVMLGGLVGIADHVKIGNGVHIAAASGVMHDIPAGQKWAGLPAQPAKDWFREVNMIRKLAGNKARKGNRDV